MALAHKNNHRRQKSRHDKNTGVIYITYDVERKNRYGIFSYAKVKRVRITGPIKEWQIGALQKKSGRKTRDIRIIYGNKQPQRAEVPKEAINLRLFSRKSELPAKYQFLLRNKE